LNEIQMVWHEHPVNIARAERGEVPINSLWLFGGAKGWSPGHSAVPTDADPENQTRAQKEALASNQPQAAALSSALIYDGLHTPYLQGDWAAWITALPALSEHLSTLERDTSLTLTGQQRAVVLTPARRRWWHFVLAPRPQPWNTWWNLPN
jgi:hypothetical protein